MGWYKKHKDNVHGILIIVSLIIIFVLAKTEIHTHFFNHFFTYKKEMDLFYEAFFSGYVIIARVAWKMLLAASVLLILSYFFYAYRWTQTYEKRGLILYNIAIGTFATLLAVYMVSSILVTKVFRVLFVPLIILMMLLIALIFINRKFYRKNKEEFVNKKPFKWFIPVLVLCAAWVAYCIVPSVKQLQETYKKEYAFYIETQKDRLTETCDYTGMADWEENYLYVRVWFVNHYNNDGEVYDMEEIAEATENLMAENGKSWYRLQQFYLSYKAICEEHKFDKYVADYEKNNAGIIFTDSVEKRLRVLGIDIKEASKEEIDTACEYVYNIFAADEEVKTIEEVSFSLVEPVPEEKPEFDVEVEPDCGYGAEVRSWERVSHVGAKNPIECLSEDMAFEYDSVYLAVVDVFHDVDSVIKDVNIELSDVEYASYEVMSGYEEGDIHVYIWFVTSQPTGEPNEMAGFETIKAFDIASLGNVSIGDSPMRDKSKVQIDNENAVVSGLSWWRVVDTNMFYMNEDQTFTDEYESYIASFGICSDTRYIMNENVKITYDNIPVNKKWSGMESDCLTYFSLYPENDVHNEARVYILYNRIRTDAENGTVTTDCDFAYNGSRVKLTTTPDEGYRFVEYVVTNNDGTKKDVEIEDDVLIMPDYPVCVTAVFEEK